MDVFEAVDSRIACRAFLDKPVDLKIVKEIIVKAQRAASGGNLQSWNVYALTGKPLADFKAIVAKRIADQDPRHSKAEYPIYPEPMFGTYKERRE
jgi:nitroreductase